MSIKRPKTTIDYLLTEVKAVIALVFPFINSLLCDTLRISVDDPAAPVPVKTLLTDGEVIYVNSEYFLDNKLTPDNRVAAIAHEVLHAAFMHPLRFANYDSFGLDGKPIIVEVLNMAADYIINDFLKQYRIGVVHSDWLWTEHVSHKESLEDVYRRLAAMLPPPPPPRNPGISGTQGGGNQQGDQDNPGVGGGQDDDQQEEGDSPSRGQGEDDNKNQKPSHILGANGEKQPLPRNQKQFDDHTSKTGSTRSEVEWKAAIQSAMQTARAAGRLPSDMERALKNLLSVKKDWTEELSDEIKACSGFDRRNMRKPNKRRLYQDRMYIPTRIGFHIDKLAFIFDVSGSVSVEETALMKGTVYEILSQCPAREIRCLCVNSQVIEDVTFSSLEEFMDWMPHGSGGTDMEAGIEHFVEDEYEPDFLIVLTDGYTSTDVSNAPDFPVIWVTTQREDLAYGKVIKMTLAEATKVAA